jgi:hypothetical protein
LWLLSRWAGGSTAKTFWGLTAQQLVHGIDTAAHVAVAELLVPTPPVFRERDAGVDAMLAKLETGWTAATGLGNLFRHGVVVFVGWLKPLFGYAN